MSGPAVALRSSDPEVVEAVRAVTALADLPLTVHPPGAQPPEARIALDSAAEIGPGDPDWRRPGGRFAWVGVEHDVDTPDGGTCLVLPETAEELLTRIRAASARRRARIIGVVGARGGAGASSLAAVLARTCADAGLSVALVDLDLDHGGIDLLLGVEHEPGLRWADLDHDPGGFVPEDLSAGLPTWHGVRVLSADLRSWALAPSEATLTALAEVHDAIVVDLPRGAARAHEPAGRWCDVMVAVAVCDVQSTAGLQVLARSWDGCDLRAVVRGPAPGGLAPHDVVAPSGIPLLAAMPPERSLAAALERGVAPGDHRRGPLLRTARAMIGDLGLRP